VNFFETQLVTKVQQCLVLSINSSSVRGCQPPIGDGTLPAAAVRVWSSMSRPRHHCLTFAVASRCAYSDDVSTTAFLSCSAREL